MCDQRPPPTSIVLSGSVVPVEYHGVIDIGYGYPIPYRWDGPELKVGNYLLSASGSFYAYYDGVQFNRFNPYFSGSLYSI